VKRNAQIRIRAPLAVALLTLPGALLHGCSSPTAPPPPPGGGNTLVLSFEEFQQNVEPVLVRQGCDATGDCHGGGIRGTLALSPPGGKDAQFDFDQIRQQVTASDRVHSPVLTEPLALDAGGTPHGYKPFASTDDPDYQSILTWIEDGVLQ
jgi:hypothetical protein